MVLREGKESSWESPLEVLSIYFRINQKKNKEESRNDETLFFHA